MDNKINAQLLSPSEYINDAINLAQKAKHRIFLIGMVVVDDKLTHRLLSTMSKKAREGVYVNIAADIFTYYDELGDPVLSIKKNNKKFKAANEMAHQFRLSKVKFHWLGKSTLFAGTGRTHSKWCVIDDTVYAFGGVNMYEKGIKTNDYMFKINDKDLADIIVQQQMRIINADKHNIILSNKSYKYKDSMVYFDGGAMGRSIIYKRACQLAKVAKSVLFVSQYCPSSTLAKNLRKIKQVDLYYNSWKQAYGFNKVIIFQAQRTSHLESKYNKDKYLHAKFMIFTMPDGSKTLLSGSNNFYHGSVLFGTREVAIETKDKKMIEQVEIFFEKFII